MWQNMCGMRWFKKWGIPMTHQGFLFCTHVRFPQPKIISNNVFSFIKIFPQIKKSCSPASLQPLVRKGFTKLPEKGELKLNHQCQDLSGFGCVLSVYFHLRSPHPISGICEKQTEKGWRISQCSQQMPSEYQRDTHVIRLKNLVAQVRANTCGTVFSHFWRHISKMHNKTRGVLLRNYPEHSAV